MATDPKTLVSRGYDEIAEAYLERFGRSLVRADKLREFIRDMPPRSKILDLGCGAGTPIASELVALGFDVTGVDSSARQIALAKNNVPNASFLQADMTTVDLPVASFDGICAFYSITHIPRDEQGPLLKRIASWLKPNGLFVGSFGIAAGDW
ncbi:MAG TPA: methyltransferase domain-containing protein, partial [Rhizomicrobium sp.]|nr:methyltransferase domain-containing protein [Rhizomicrobium sp.]